MALRAQSGQSESWHAVVVRGAPPAPEAAHCCRCESGGWPAEARAAHRRRRFCLSMLVAPFWACGWAQRLWRLSATGR
eukprot:11226437-Lingulodinium_polyedra.AAC.1